MQNLSQKINAKLGCINGVVNLQNALSRPSKDDHFMFFGADVSRNELIRGRLLSRFLDINFFVYLFQVTHTTCSVDRPSIAAVVGSRDRTNSLYTARLCERMLLKLIHLLKFLIDILF